jgi:NAD(P)-dependent dehydrogenase (short-subunit alcohol dehydrogenase family)
MPDDSTIILLGASRGLGLGLAEAYLGRGWHVIATARDPARATDLSALQAAHPGHLRIAAMDVAAEGAGKALAEQLVGIKADILFVVAGQNSASGAPIHDVPAATAAAEFITNAWAPPVVAEALFGVLKPGGTVALMTSRLGSLALNKGGTELYGASKAALNMLGIAFAARHPQTPVVLMHPGWVRTDMGGAGAPLDVPTSVKGMADTLGALTGKAGVHYVDYQGKVLPW